jgi:hypothetical protein
VYAVIQVRVESFLSITPRKELRFAIPVDGRSQEDTGDQSGRIDHNRRDGILGAARFRSRANGADSSGDRCRRGRLYYLELVYLSGEGLSLTIVPPSQPDSESMKGFRLGDLQR